MGDTNNQPPTVPTGGRREFWIQVEVVGEHWLWRGARNSRGYGLFGPKMAQRVAWQEVGRALPAGYLVKVEACPDKLCIRPDHWRVKLPRRRPAPEMHWRDCAGCDRRFECPVSSRRKFHDDRCKRQHHQLDAGALADELEALAAKLRKRGRP